MKNLWEDACSVEGVKQLATTYLMVADKLRVEKDGLGAINQFAEYVAGEDAHTLISNAAISFALEDGHPPFVRDRFSDVTNGDKTPGSMPTENFADAYLERLFEMGQALAKERGKENGFLRQSLSRKDGFTNRSRVQ